MSEMIERVAKAIEGVIDRASAGQPEGLFLEECASAAIEAMREPTNAMAAFVYRECGTIDLATKEDFFEHYSDVWESMIDAALGAKP
jgi:hypothetical protein